MNSDHRASKGGNLVNRRSFLKKTAGAAIAAPWIMRYPNAYGRSSAKRNIIFILSDDHRYDALSYLTTPSPRRRTWTSWPGTASCSRTPS